jgi:3-hydroxyisobutyrate dehydrogenase-like beta-hydroxyacid dehydrogenase
MQIVAEIVARGGADVVDGAIIGHPAWKPGTTYIHLSGPSREKVAGCFEGSVLGTVTMSDRVGEASALKMCYAALTKGTAALLCGILATADELGVREALNRQWEADGAGRAGEREATVCGVPAKAWRWVDEMEEIARTFEGAGQPGGFHQASAEIFRRLSCLKDGPHPSELAVVLGKLKG